MGLFLLSDQSSALVATGEREIRNLLPQEHGVVSLPDVSQKAFVASNSGSFSSSDAFRGANDTEQSNT
jgi:hypothetical protein